MRASEENFDKLRRFPPYVLQKLRQHSANIFTQTRATRVKIVNLTNAGLTLGHAPIKNQPFHATLVLIIASMLDDESIEIITGILAAGQIGDKCYFQLRFGRCVYDIME